MDKLAKAGLYGAGLIEINSPAMVERYNQCLEAVGSTRTELTRFWIDGAGWSPDIAQEKSGQNYLSVNEATRVAIIVSPDQRGLPSHHPTYSFEEVLLDRLFESHSEEIADVTQSAALWIELDHGLSAFSSPRDLLLVDNMHVRAHVLGGLVEHAERQRALCSRFMNQTEAWFNPELRASIIQTAAEHGDFRERRLRIPDFVFEDTQHFYAEAFGGVFVFRKLANRDNILICKDVVQAVPIRNQRTNVYAVTNPAWLDALVEENMIEISPIYYSRNIKSLHYLQECLFVDTVSAHEPDADFVAMTLPQRNAFVKKYREHFPAEFFELERLTKRVEQTRPLREEPISPGLELLLYHPRDGQPQMTTALLWQLLNTINPVDVAQLFHTDKADFYEQYRTWSEPKQRWAITIIEQRKSAAHH